MKRIKKAQEIDWPYRWETLRKLLNKMKELYEDDRELLGDEEVDAKIRATDSALRHMDWVEERY
jgi:hypothetical protein